MLRWSEVADYLLYCGHLDNKGGALFQPVKNNVTAGRLQSPKSI